MTDHRILEAEDTVGRYLRRELEPEDEERFELHLLTCSICQDEVEADARFGLALAEVASVEVAAIEVASVEEDDGRPPAPGRRVPWIWAASLLMALLPAWLFYRQGEAIERRSTARIQALQAELQASRDASSTATRPQIGVPVVYLAPLRETRPDGPSALRLSLSAEPRWVVLAVETADTAGRYGLTLKAHDG